MREMYELERVIAENIRKFREDREWSQAKLAAEAQSTIMMIRKWEEGLVSPTINAVARIARALDVAPSELMLWRP